VRATTARTRMQITVISSVCACCVVGPPLRASRPSVATRSGCGLHNCTVWVCMAEGGGSGLWGCLLRLRVALVLTFVQLCFSGYAIISQSVLHKSSAAGSASGAGTEGKALNPAVFIVCRDVGCSIVLLVAGRIQAGKFLWPEPQDRFLFVLIGICNVSPTNARPTGTIMVQLLCGSLNIEPHTV
jgi:hypothetical protein